MKWVNCKISAFRQGLCHLEGLGQVSVADEPINLQKVPHPRRTRPVFRLFTDHATGVPNARSRENMAVRVFVLPRINRAQKLLNGGKIDVERASSTLLPDLLESVSKRADGGHHLREDAAEGENIGFESTQLLAHYFGRCVERGETGDGIRLGLLGGRVGAGDAKVGEVDLVRAGMMLFRTVFDAPNEYVFRLDVHVFDMVLVVKERQSARQAREEGTQGRRQVRIHFFVHELAQVVFRDGIHEDVEVLASFDNVGSHDSQDVCVLSAL